MASEPASAEEPPMDAFAQIAMKLFGFIVSKTEEQELTLLGNQLRKARVSFPAKEYLASALLISIMSGAFMFLFFHLLTYHPANMLEAYSTVLRNFIIAAVISVLNLGIFYIYPYYASDIREADINANLMFGVNHMLAVLKAGGSLEDSIRTLSTHQEFGEMRREGENFMKKMRIPNMTLPIALRKTADECPSEALQSLLDHLSMAITTGTEAQSYLEGEFNSILEQYKKQEAAKIGNIQTLTHTYLVLLIAIPSIVMLAMAGLTLSPALSFIISRYQLFIFSPLILFAIDIIYLAYLELKEPDA